MIVSRETLVYDELIDFPVEERFLKLPVKKFFDLQEITPIYPQNAMINAINDPQYRFVVACLSRRTGKTFAANHIAFLKAMEPGTQVLIISPNYSLSNISWMEQVRLLKDYNIDTDKMNAKDKEIHLANGSLIKLGSVSQVNSCVGRSYDLILFDEAALDPKGRDAFNIQLRPTLDKANSKAIFISTPRGTNYFHDFYMRGFDIEFPKWISIHSTWEDNPRTTREDIDDARASMSKAEFQQEYEADFTTFEGQIYESFNWDKCVRDLDMMDFAHSSRYDRLMGIDPGYKDFTAALVSYYDMEDDLFYITWDYQDNELTTAQHAEKLYKAFEQNNVDMVFCDSAAAQFRQDMAAMYDLPSYPAKKSVLDGLGYCQSLVEQDKIIIDKRCIYVLDMMRNYRWDPRPELLKPKPLHDKFSHIGDAFRYMLYSYTR